MLKLVAGIPIVVILAGCTMPALSVGTLVFEDAAWTMGENGTAMADLRFSNRGDLPLRLSYAYSGQRILLADGRSAPLDRANGWNLREDGTVAHQAETLVQNGTVISPGEETSFTVRMQFRDPAPSDFIKSYVALFYSIDGERYAIDVHLPCVDWLGHELPRDNADFGWGDACMHVAMRRD